MIPGNLAAKIGLWAHVTERLSGRLHDIAAVFDYVVVKIADGSSEYHPEALRSIRADMAAAKLTLTLAYWAYVYPDDPAGNAKAILAALPEDATDLVLDAEVEWENAKATLGAPEVILRAHELCRAIKAARPALRLHLSSFWSPKLHADFPFRAFLLHCETWMPQAYFEPGGRTVDEVEAGAIAQGRSLIAGTKLGMVPTVNNTQFLPLLKAHGGREFNVYAWDPEGDAQVIDNLAAWAAAVKAYREPASAK